MTSWILLFAFLASFATSWIAMCWLRSREIDYARVDNYLLVRQRLDAYAIMKDKCATEYRPPESNLDFVPSAMILNDEQHQILLGVLKKAEAKSTVWVVAVIFAIPSIDGILWKNVGETLLPRTFLMLCGGIFATLLLFGVLGARHLGQPDFRSLSKVTSVQIRGRELQRQLVDDMLLKEAALKYSNYFGSLALVLAAMAISVRPL